MLASASEVGELASLIMCGSYAYSQRLTSVPNISVFNGQTANREVVRTFAPSRSCDY